MVMAVRVSLVCLSAPVPVWSSVVGSVTFWHWWAGMPCKVQKAFRFFFVIFALKSGFCERFCDFQWRNLVLHDLVHHLLHQVVNVCCEVHYFFEAKNHAILPFFWSNFLKVKKSWTLQSCVHHLPNQVSHFELVNVHGEVHYFLKAKIHTFWSFVMIFLRFTALWKVDFTHFVKICHFVDRRTKLQMTT